MFTLNHIKAKMWTLVVNLMARSELIVQITVVDKKKKKKAIATAWGGYTVVIISHSQVKSR